MDRRVRRREVLRMLLGAAGFVLAILIGFALGLRVGDRRNNPSRGAEAIRSDSAAFLAAIPDTSGTGSYSAAPTEAIDTAAVPAGSDSTDAGAGSAVSATAQNTQPHRDTLKGKMAEIARKEAARGTEYLTSHNRWNRDEMEKISALQGLWDAVNTYDLEEIRRYNEVFDCPPLATIIEGLERTHKQGYYASKKDHVITLSTYIKRLQSQ
ncbi:MAG: hypothetical protein K6G79_03990 [Bacteroidales bacterium]|nr:hypothetical protein [Bacteroidales bacterium]